ncbi:MAG TPA: ABC transporter permease [Candidatus Acidoferrales bacterium]|nr:ABC transporter permease [Candidatus Acidoferrales bacterium]
MRSLIRSAAFTVSAVLTLALGIASATALFTIVNGVLLHPLPYRDSGRLLEPAEPMMAADFRDIQSQNNVFEQMAMYEQGRYVLSKGGEAQFLTSEAISPGFFSMLGVAPLFGRSFEPREYEPGAANIVLLSYAVWARSFDSDPRILGSSIFLNSRPYIVIGVLPRWFRFKDRWFAGDTDVWLPLALTPSQLEQHGGPKWTPKGPAQDSYSVQIIGCLKRGVTIEKAQRNFDGILERLAAEYPQDKALLKNSQLYSLTSLQAGPIAGILWPLFGGAALLLLVACVNVSGLTLARGLARRREMAIRSVLGAPRRKIAGHFLIESLLLSFSGAVLAIPISIGLLDVFKFLAPPAYAPWFQHAGIDRWVFLFAVLAVLLCTVFCGLLTAVVCSRSDPNSDLKSRVGSCSNLRTGRGFNAQKWLLIVQIGAAMLLLVAASLMGRSLWLVLHENLGFDPHNVAMVSLLSANYQNPDAARSKAFEQQLLDNVKTLPVIQLAAFSQVDFKGVAELPFSTSASPSGPADSLPTAYWWGVTPEFFSLMHIPLVRGRYFSNADALNTEPVVVVNQTLAHIFFSGSNPVGKRITYFTYDPLLKKVDAEIVGVVPDTKMTGFRLPAGPEIYTCLWQQNWAFASLFVRSDASHAALVSALREKIRQTDQGFALLDAKPVEQAVEESFFARPKFLTFLFAAFSLLALMLTIVGIFGAAALSVTRRTREIGIRVALGAQKKHVLKTVLWDASITCLSGVTIGVIAALVLTRLIRSWLYGISPSDPITFIVSAILLLVVCLVASYIPSRRALRVDPAVTLRYE